MTQMGWGEALICSTRVQSPDSDWPTKGKNTPEALTIRGIREIRGQSNCLDTAEP